MSSVNSTRAGDIVSFGIVEATLDAHVGDVVDAVREKDATHIAVFDEGSFDGLVKLQDIVGASPLRILADQTIDRTMPCVQQGATLTDVIAALESAHVEAVQVADEAGRFVGVITEHSLLNALVLHEQGQREESDRLRRTIEANHQRTQAILDTAVDAVITIDERGVVETFNAAAERMFGYNAAEVLGENISKLMPPVHRARHDESIARYLDTGEAKVIGIGRETEGMRKDGTMFPIELSISESCVFGKRWFTGIVRDITERERARNAVREAHDMLEQTVLERTAELRQSEAKYRDLFESANDVILSTDRFGNIRMINRRGVEATGFTLEELRRFNIVRDLLVPECVERVRGVLSRLVRGQSATYEVQWRRKDGGVIDFEVSSSPVMSPDGEFVATRCILRDITERKRAEEALRRANDELETRVAERTAELVEAHRVAEAANRAKSAFLANMSHEIRTPMTAILGFAENLLDRDVSSSMQLNAVNTIHRNGKHLLRIINDILDVSKIEAGQMTVERIPCAPCEIVAHVMSLMQPHGAAQGLSVEVEYTGKVPEMIRSDPTRLSQILLNLMSNAIKFTRQGGVRLQVGLVETERGAALMQFDVIDTGIGMTEEQAAKVFEPFSQADASTTRRFGGSGLGMTISRWFAERLGGELTIVRSAPRRGTHMRLSVDVGPLNDVVWLDPATIPRDEHGDPARLTSNVDGKLSCRILLAEDGVDNQRLISYVLAKAGADVTVVENGKEASDRAIAATLARRQGESPHPFDVILMDMQMPVMDGHAATGLLRQKGYDGLIIALTAHAMTDDRQKCLDAGCDDYATKPIDRKELIGLITRLLTQRARSTPDTR